MQLYAGKVANKCWLHAASSSLTLEAICISVLMHNAPCNFKISMLNHTKKEVCRHQVYKRKGNKKKNIYRTIVLFCNNFKAPSARKITLNIEMKVSATRRKNVVLTY